MISVKKAATKASYIFLLSWIHATASFRVGAKSIVYEKNANSIIKVAVL